MKNLLIIICFVPLMSFAQGGNDNKKNVSEIKMTSGFKNDQDFYIISISGTADVKEAVEQVKGLRAKGHPAGYLWLPEYPINILSLNPKF